MQRSVILGHVRDRYGIASDDGLLTATVINAFIDRAVKKVELANDWAWLETVETITTVNGTATYATATTYVRTISCRIAEAAPMLKLSIDEADHWGETNVGVSKAYANDGRLLRFIPTPNANLSVRHRFLRTETALAADSSEPLMPEPWIEAVITWAGYLCAEREARMDAAGERKAEYADILGSLKGRASEDADTTGGGAVAVPVEG